MKDRFGGRNSVPASTIRTDLYSVSDLGILYLREMNGQSPEGPGIQLFDSTEPYSIRRLFESLFSEANKDIKIIDNYVGKRTLDYIMYAKGKNIQIKILTSNNKERGFDEAFAEFEEEFDGGIIIQERPGVFHGRIIIVDGQTFILDHSIKDFGSKSSSITRVDEPFINEKCNELFNNNWDE